MSNPMSNGTRSPAQAIPVMAAKETGSAWEVKSVRRIHPVLHLCMQRLVVILTPKTG